MSLFMLGGPKLQLFNNEGHPYSDSEGVTENEQPVEMDAAGRPDSGARCTCRRSPTSSCARTRTGS